MVIQDLIKEGETLQFIDKRMKEVFLIYARIVWTYTLRGLVKQKTLESYELDQLYREAQSYRINEDTNSEYREFLSRYKIYKQWLNKYEFILEEITLDDLFGDKERITKLKLLDLCDNLPNLKVNLDSKLQIVH